MYLNRFILLSFLVPFLNVCSSNTTAVPPGQWQFEGLESTTIHKVKKANGDLVIATADGVYFLKGKTFNRGGLKGEDVVDIVAVEDGNMLAGLGDYEYGTNTLFKTTNEGDSWQPHMGNYGGDEGKYTLINALATHPNNKNMLFASGWANISRSLDGGNTWESVFLDWGYVGSTITLKVDPQAPNTIYGGGANAIGSPTLVTSKDGGDSWQHLQVLENVETYVRTMAIHPSKSNTLLVGMAGSVSAGNIIRKSTDGGEKWVTVLKEIGCYTLAQSLRDPEIIYASGRNKSGTLFFASSMNFGDTWEITEMEESPSGIRVNDMISIAEEGKEVLYFGTNKGIYSYRFER